jgi:hypothetical protein
VSGDAVVCSRKELYELVGECGDGAANKRVPAWLRGSPPAIIGRFVEAAILGDGWTQRGARTYATISKLLADDMQELFIKLGRTANIRPRPGKPWAIRGRSGVSQGQFHVSECRSSRQYLVKDGAERQEFIGQWVPYDGTVYCATVPNGTLICRRNGLAFIAGNCRAYARAAAAVAGLDRWQEVDWVAHERALSPSPPPPAPPAPRREPWLRRSR